LAGDIGEIDTEYKKLIQKTSNNFKYVFLCKGNHECYGHTVAETDILLQNICDKYDNVFYLNQTVIEVENIIVIGTTLWSDIQECQRKDIEVSFNDLYQIKDWSIDEQNFQHFSEKTFIEQEINKAKRSSKKILVITHHAPSLTNTSDPKFNNSVISSAFASDLEYLFNKNIIWVYGHTHYSNDQIIKETRLISNQRGYPGENTGFNCKTFTL